MQHVWVLSKGIANEGSDILGVFLTKAAAFLSFHTQTQSLSFGRATSEAVMDHDWSEDNYDPITIWGGSDYIELVCHEVHV